MIGKRSFVIYESFRRNFSKNFTSNSSKKAVDTIVKRNPEVARAILENTEITRNHMTPEIQLFLLTSNCKLYYMPVDQILNFKKEFLEAFWSIYWPGGQALTRFVLDERKQFVSSRKILDLGAGCGASSIAAKLIGARRVIANDINQYACTAISMNAALNHVDVEISQENLLHQPPEKSIDVIFIGDMLYEEEIASILIPWLEIARQNGTRVYLGDPGRHCLTDDLKKRMEMLRQYTLPENVRKEHYGYSTSEIWEFRE